MGGEGLILGWVVVAIIIGFLGSDRKIGFVGSFFLSLLLSPIIGAIFVATSGKAKKFNKQLVNLNSKAMQIKSKDLDRAIAILKNALQISPNSPRTNYNIACFYSLSKDKKNAYFHLEKAINNGYDRLIHLSKDKDLAWLREQNEYQEFIENNYSLKSNIEDDKNKSNYIHEIRELKKLNSEGIITDKEFDEKKKELLSSQ